MSAALERRARAAFVELSHDEVVAAIKRMRAEGMSDHTIARACRLAVEEIRRVLAEAGS